MVGLRSRCRERDRSWVARMLKLGGFSWVHWVHAMLDLGMLIGDGFQKDGGDEVGQGVKKRQQRGRNGNRVLTGAWRGTRQCDLTRFGFGWSEIVTFPSCFLSF